MRKLLALLLVAAVLVAAKPVPVESSIAVAADSDLRFGGAVTFDTTTEKLKGWQYPMVYVVCYQDGSLVYGQLDHPDATFILGGGWSLWWTHPGPADCEALLYAYSASKSEVTLLAGTATFHAEG